MRKSEACRYLKATHSPGQACLQATAAGGGTALAMAGLTQPPSSRPTSDRNWENAGVHGCIDCSTFLFTGRLRHNDELEAEPIAPIHAVAALDGDVNCTHCSCHRHQQCSSHKQATVLDLV
jgi:hypothetical protein